MLEQISKDPQIIVKLAFDLLNTTSRHTYRRTLAERYGFKLTNSKRSNIPQQPLGFLALHTLANQTARLTSDEENHAREDDFVDVDFVGPAVVDRYRNDNA